MTQNIIDITSLQNALAQLQESLEFLKSDLAKDRKLYNQFRSASIQAFEYSYELSHKSLKRYLQMTMPSREVIDEMSFQELIRTGFEKGLLKNSWSVWKSYRDARNHSSHAYSESIADDILKEIPKFLEEALFSMSQAKAMNKLDLDKRQLDIVLGIIKKYIPTLEVWAFGSRVQGRAKIYSDLDLAIISEKRVNSNLMIDLKEAFDESDLDIKIDILDFGGVSPSFQQIITNRHYILYKP